MIEETLEEQGVIFKMLPIHQLSKGSYQLRYQFDEAELLKLAETVKQVGILQPLVVRQKSANLYEIIAGERRFRAAQIAELKEVPCLISNDLNQQSLIKGIIENIARENLNPIDEAKGMQRLIEEFNFSHEAVAKVFGKSRSEISNSLRLLKLDAKVQLLLMDGDLSATHGRLLAGVAKENQYVMAEKAIAKSWSMRALEKVIQQQKQVLKPKTPKQSNKVSVDLQRLERQLSEQLCTELKFEEKSKNNGYLKIRYHNLDELEGILQRLGWQDE